MGKTLRASTEHTPQKHSRPNLTPSLHPFHSSLSPPHHHPADRNQDWRTTHLEQITSLFMRVTTGARPLALKSSPEIGARGAHHHQSTPEAGTRLGSDEQNSPQPVSSHELGSVCLSSGLKFSSTNHQLTSLPASNQPKPTQPGHPKPPMNPHNP
ncbi:hypothetical protein PGT21_034010 [Puccinia graminis f. sp. tritici]|uniref:Uncharacterized protein n=2 Tax=Puccinia graminis f. sp. tritici TaxID=56615 RepID=A0A5B0P1G1_PUCGR|nr:hypothetical protein PGT21_034010 [Puccinia graminis f. sp. tritici]